MQRRKIDIILIALFLLFSGHAVVAQQTAEKPPAGSVGDPREFQGRIFQLKHRDPDKMVSLLRPLGSGYPGSDMRANSEFKTLTVRDLPGNIEAIEEAIAKLDVPYDHPEITNIELHLHVLLASRQENGGKDHPAEIEGVLKQLQSTLNYKSYYLLTSVVQRAGLGRAAVGGDGQITVGVPLFDRPINANYQYEISDVRPEFPTGGSPIVHLQHFEFRLAGNPSGNPAGTPEEGQWQLGSASVVTNLSIRSGEQVVVGTASLKDKAMVLVLSARFIK